MTITTTFLNEVRTAVKDYLDDNITHMAVGSDGTAATVSDAALGSEDFRNAVAEVDKATTPERITQTMLVDATDNNGNDIDEFGGLDASSGGTLAFRVVLNSTLVKTSDVIVYLEKRTDVTVTESE